MITPEDAAMKIRQLELERYPTPPPIVEKPVDTRVVTFESDDEGVTCRKCGAIMQRAGSCYSCPECGETTGCG